MTDTTPTYGEEPANMLTRERDRAIETAREDLIKAERIVRDAKKALDDAAAGFSYFPNDLRLYGNVWTDVVRSTDRAGLLIDLAARVAP